MEKHFIREINNNISAKNREIKLASDSEKVENLVKLYTAPDISTLEQLTELELSNCNLIDITCSFEKLPLKKLNLSKNKLTQIPRCFYLGLEKLEFLDISNNKLKCFEVEPNCCETLRKLILCSNELKDIPEWVMNHRAIKLKELYYDFNKITTLYCIFGITMNFSVPKLSLRNCILRDEDCAFLKNCRCLEELDISNVNEITRYLNLIRTVDKLLYQPNWKNLSVLKMNNLSLSVYPDGLNSLVGLNELHLTNNRFISLPNDGLEYLVHLQIFDLSHNFIVYLPEKLVLLKNLKILILSYNRLETSCEFSKMQNLEVLDLYNNRLTTLDQPMACENLRCLDVELNFINTKEWDVSNYHPMKDKLRARIPEEFRSNGVLEFTYLNNSCYDSDVESYSSDYVSEAEDWDEELKLREQITPSDDEWDGEPPLLPYIPINHFEKPSVYNDYMIFCDAD